MGNTDDPAVCSGAEVPRSCLEVTDPRGLKPDAAPGIEPGVPTSGVTEWVYPPPTSGADPSAPAREPGDENAVAMTMTEVVATTLRIPFLPSLPGICALHKSVSSVHSGRDDSGVAFH